MPRLPIVCLALAACLASAAEPPAAWLNAREVGASGSSFTTPAATTAGSNQITVQDPGDFQPGQGVMVSRCNIHVSHATLWGPRAKYAVSQPLDGRVEMRGFDGSQGSWVVYVFDVDGADPPTFRWTDDLGRTWKGAHIPISGDWQPLDHGLEVRFKPFAWNDRYSAVLAWRDQLISTIEKVDGNVLTLKDPANRTAGDAVVRHNDGAALQAGIDRAIAEKRSLFIPPGQYRIATSLVAANAGGLTVQGASPVNTVIDIGEGEGPCFVLRGGTEVNLRDLGLSGNSSYADRDQCGWLRTEGGTALWGMYFRFSAALNVNGTERVLAENCHARKMSGECFYSQGPGRMGTQPEPPQYTKSITYLRCSVEDCGRNAFNNNDYAENTSVLQCRVRDVGGCTWEGPGRFVHFVGNYVRNGGVVAVGNAFNRLPEFEELPSGQTIVADNTFEDGVNYGACAIRAGCGATEVVIRNNLFVNWGTHAIDVSGAADANYLPAGQALISGNLIDLTAGPAYDLVRSGITVSGSDVIVSDNQVYVRGAANPRATGIRLGEPATHLNVHDNLVRNCGAGLVVNRARSSVAEPVDARTFRVTRGDIPLERRRSHRYRGWHLVWMQGKSGVGRSVIEAFDPEQCTFHLTADHPAKAGDAFEVYPPGGFDWNLHDNTIADCPAAAELDGYGGPTSVFRGNLVSSGGSGVAIKGEWSLVDNLFAGLAGAALSLAPDRFGQPLRSTLRGNTFRGCAKVLDDASKPLWAACQAEGNRYIDCGGAPVSGGTASTTPAPKPVTVAPAARPKLLAPRPPAKVAIDGDVAEWPWGDKARVAEVAQTPDGQPIASPRSLLLAAADKDWLYLALRVVTPPNYTVHPATDPYNGDGMEVAFRSTQPGAPAAILMLYGSANGEFWPHPSGGASGAQMAQLAKDCRYATRPGKDQWTAEWRIPRAVLGAGQAGAKRLQFNVGIFHQAAGLWVAWVGTGAEIFRVESAGDVVIGG